MVDEIKKPKRAQTKNLVNKTYLTSDELVEGRNWSIYKRSDFGFVETNSVDLILTDPPFNIARDTNFHTYEGNTINSYRFDKEKGWDSYSREEFVSLLGEWSREFHRVLRKGGSFAVFCADKYVSYLYHALEDAGLSPRRTVTWRKPNAVPVNRSVMMMSSCEFIITGVKDRNSVFNADIDGSSSILRQHIESLLVADKVASIVELSVRQELMSRERGKSVTPVEVSRHVNDVLQKLLPGISKRVEKMYRSKGDAQVLEGCVPNAVVFNSKSGQRLHPTEKPVSLLSYLIALLSEPNALVLDPFSGSASTGEAAVGLGRRVVLVEKDEEFFQKGVVRLKGLESQSVLDFE